MLKRHTISFRHALDGLLWAVRTQPNFLIHLVVSIGVVVGGISLKVSSLEWLILGMCITLGLVVELLNTAIEAVTDLITQEYRDYAKIAKDVSAAAMLVFACGSAALALAIFLPKM